MRHILFIFFLVLLNSEIFSINTTKVDSLNHVIKNSKDTVKYETTIALAIVYYNDYQLYKAIKYINQSVNLLPTDIVRQAKANNFLGMIYYQLGDFPTALIHHLKSLKYREEIGDVELLAVAYNGIGVVYSALGSLEQSNYYLEKALVFEKKQNNIKNLAMLYNNISNNYMKQKQYPIALDYLLKSEAIIDKTDLDKTLLLINIGDLYSHTNEISKAQEYFNTAINYSKETNNNYYLCLAYQNVAALFLSQRDYKQSLYYYKASVHTAGGIDANEVLKKDYKGFVNIYSIMDKPDSVIKYNELFFAINDSIFNKQSADKTAELQTKYDFEKQEKEIELLIVQNNLADKKQKVLIAIFVLSFFLIIIVFLIMYNKNRRQLADQLSIKKNKEIVKYETVIDNSVIEPKEIIEPKDSNSTLSEEFKTMLELSISKKIRKEKLYLKNDFTLHDLAKILDTNRRYVSQVINERFEQNFSSFINEFRIKEAMKLMSDPNYQKFTIDSISKKVGFNSISAFNGAFKKVTGITPSTFAKSLA